jgi:hypothetical protein
MLFNIGYINIVVIYCHSTIITKELLYYSLLYNTELWYDYGMAVNYYGKKFYNIGPNSYSHIPESSFSVSILFCLIR